MKITKQRLRQVIKEELVNMGDLLAPGLGEDVRFTTVESRDDAMRGADRPGSGIEDIAAMEDEETRDRAFGSPEERLITLINARDVLSQMTQADLEALSLSLDAPMVATLRHILANPMYAPMEEGQDEAQDLIRKAEFEESKGRLHQGDVDRIKQRLAAGERVHSIKRDYRRNF